MFFDFDYVTKSRIKDFYNTIKSFFVKNFKKLIIVAVVLFVPVCFLLLRHTTRQVETFQREYYDNGQLRFERRLFNGVEEGLATTYYRNGDRMFETMYREGKRHGKRKEYYEGGILSDVWQYNGGKLHGLAIRYYDHGITEKRRFYANGKLNGPFADYYPNGQLKTKGIYVNDEFTVFERYDTENNLISEILR